MVRNLFENELPTDNCPFCGAKGCSCNSYLNDERILNLETGALILVTENLYEDVEVNGELEKHLRWRPGEFITPAEADRLGVREVPFVVRLAREGAVLEEKLGMQGMGENKSMGAKAENKQGWRPDENKAERATEDKAPNHERWEDEGGAPRPEPEPDEEQK